MQDECDKILDLHAAEAKQVETDAHQPWCARKYEWLNRGSIPLHTSIINIMNYIVVLRNTDGSKELIWFDNMPEAAEFGASRKNAVQVIETTCNKAY